MDYRIMKELCQINNRKAIYFEKHVHVRIRKWSQVLGNP